MKQNCKTCHYWKQATSHGMIYGYCEHDQSFMEIPGKRKLFAITSQDDSCKEHKSKTSD